MPAPTVAPALPRRPGRRPELEAAFAAAEASWQQDQPEAAPEARPRQQQAGAGDRDVETPRGATIAQISEATGGSAPHDPGTFAGALKKKPGLTIVSEKIEEAAGTPRTAPLPALR